MNEKAHKVIIEYRTTEWATYLPIHAFIAF